MQQQPTAMRVTVNHLPRQCHWPFIRHSSWLRTRCDSWKIITCI